MKILFLADLHIHFPKKVPKDWQVKRFMMLVDEINKVQCDLIILGGDTLDSCKPSPEEVEVFFEFLAGLKTKTYIYSGNHEALTKKVSVLEHFIYEINRCNPLVKVITSNVMEGFDVIDYKDLHKDFPYANDICFTHVRGAIPPHVIPEVSLEKFDKYKLVFAGDLHSHENSQLNIHYPGSPLTTTFHRSRTIDSNGMFLIDTEAKDFEWINLSHLPQLLKVTVTSKDEIVPTEYDFTMYDMEGTVDELATISGTELLDKKVNIVETKPATIDFSNINSVNEEMYYYLTNIAKVSDVDSLMKRFNNYANK